MNKAVLSGNLGKDPELRYTTSGKAVASFSVATKEKFDDKELTDWHNIVVWGKRAENVSQQLKKGDLIFVIGRITNRSWDDKDGNKRYITEIVAESLGYTNKEAVDNNVTPQDNVVQTDDLPF